MSKLFTVKKVEIYVLNYNSWQQCKTIYKKAQPCFKIQSFWPNIYIAVFAWRRYRCIPWFVFLELNEITYTTLRDLLWRNILLTWIKDERVQDTGQTKAKSNFLTFENKTGLEDSRCFCWYTCHVCLSVLINVHFFLYKTSTLF